MAAYSALVAFEQLLNQLSNSDLLPKEDVVSLHGKIFSLKSSLEKIFPAPKKDRDEANELATRIREKVFEAQDTIEFFIFSSQNHQPESQETSKSQSLTSFSLQEIIAGIDPITEDSKKLSDSIDERNKVQQPVDESQTYKLSVSGRKIMIVGQDKYKELLIEKLLATTDSRLVIPITGMQGIGKTFLVRNIYDDASIKSKFPYRAWVTVSQDANVQEILGKLLSSLENMGQKAGDKKYEGDEAKLRVELHQALSNNKYLVVIDDLWDLDIWMRLKTALPDNQNSSRVLITTRISEVADSVGSTDGLEMQPLDEEDSWTLLRNRTFGDDKECPENLVDIGRDIAKHCKGLPLSLTVIGGLLSQGRKEAEYWQSVEQETRTAADKAKVEDVYLGILSLSYDHLPCQLKGCFLYMAAFPQDSEIAVSKLIMLWVAEGFIIIPPPRPLSQLVDRAAELRLCNQLFEQAAEKALLELIDRNMVLMRKNRSDGRIKTCGMHVSLRDLAEKESQKDMFFHLRKNHLQKVEQGTNTQRRVSVHNNILMCLEHVYDSTKKIEKARSLLYVGPHHHHPMPFNLTFDLLRVLDAFSFFFIQFPDEVLKLVHLRYLSLTYNGKLPSKIAKLHKLQVLIVKRLPRIIYVGAPFLPDEIWNVKELRHLIVTETDLPLLPPTEQGSILFENLQTLSNVNATSCTQEVLDNMPNLKKLKMWAEAPGTVGLYLNKLDQLKVFKFSVLEPIPGEKVEFGPKLFFPNTVRKLCLSGTGLPWVDMEAIAALPNLQVLKLKELAFHGDEWCPDYSFRKLKFLLIEYLNLRKWEANPSHFFPCLEQLILRHCYDLEELPSDIEELENLRLIELEDCSPDAVAWAEEVKTTAENFGNNMLRVSIYSSCEY